MSVNGPLSVVDEWLLIAYDDLDSAKFLFDHKHPKPLEIICYHCQQSVEKSLKAFLVSRGREAPKIHDCGKICGLCIDVNSAFEPFLHDCIELALYATNTRYPSRMEMEERNAVSALRKAAAIHAFVSELRK